ncbi:hypothetical protein ACFE04_011246 [Oxalis oulophora]
MDEIDKVVVKTTNDDTSDDEEVVAAGKNKKVKDKAFTSEVNVDADYLREYNLLGLLENSLLKHITCCHGEFAGVIVKEFYCNLQKFINTFGARHFQNIYVRAMRNWMPTCHSNIVSLKLCQLLFQLMNFISFSLGNIVYENVCSYSGQPQKFGNLVFPSTIYMVLCAQGLVVLEDEEMNTLP